MTAMTAILFVHDKIFEPAQNRERSHDKIFIVILNPDIKQSHHAQPKSGTKRIFPFSK